MMYKAYPNTKTGHLIAQSQEGAITCGAPRQIVAERAKERRQTLSRPDNAVLLFGLLPLQLFLAIYTCTAVYYEFKKCD